MWLGELRNRVDSGFDWRESRNSFGFPLQHNQVSAHALGCYFITRVNSGRAVFIQMRFWILLSCCLLFTCPLSFAHLFSDGTQLIIIMNACRLKHHPRHFTKLLRAILHVWGRISFGFVEFNSIYWNSKRVVKSIWNLSLESITYQVCYRWALVSHSVHRVWNTIWL